MTDSDQDDSDLETQKWRFERDCRLRELDFREREQANKDAELELRRGEQRAATWRNPLTVAILVAALAGASNAIVTVVNGSLQRELEATRRAAEITLEKTKAESTRILEMIKTGDSERAANNLDFLIQSGLVTDDGISSKLSKYLANRAPGSGPSLPSAGERIGFDESVPANRSMEQLLQNRLNDYLKYLDKVGFPPSQKKVMIQIEAKQINNAYYDGNKIVIDKRFADDPVVALREYMHHVLNINRENNLWMGQYSAMESGLADYFACSFLNNPKVGESIAKVLQIGKPYLRVLDNGRTFSDFMKLKDQALTYEGGEIWGGLFWKLREKLGAASADKLIAAAWLGFTIPKVEELRASAFAQKILDESKKLGGAPQQTVSEVLRERGFTASQ